MADFTTLKTYIQNYVKQNGNAEITGEVLQDVLVAMVEALGDTAINEISVGLSDETTARQNADGALQQNITAEKNRAEGAESTLQQNINDEQTARQNADTALQNLINGITTDIQNGYVYTGIATPSTTPVSGKVFYLALTAGTYTNFGATVVSQGINILKYNGSAWSLDTFIGIDDAPTQGSNNFVKSGGVLNSIIKDGSAFDLSAYNGGTTYADLSAALTALNALPAAYKKGGMTFKFVRTSDNKYVQFRCIADEFTTDVTQWQGVDNEPTPGSENTVKSGGVFGFTSPVVPKLKYNKTNVSGWATYGYFKALAGYTYTFEAKLSEAANANKFFLLTESPTSESGIPDYTLIITEGNTEGFKTFTNDTERTIYIRSYGTISGVEITIENDTIKEIGGKIKSLEDGLSEASNDLEHIDCDVYGGTMLIEDNYVDNLNFNGTYVTGSDFCTSYIEVKKEKEYKIKVTNSESSAITVRIGVATTTPANGVTGTLLKTINISANNYAEYAYTANADGYLSVSGWKSDSVKNPQFYAIGKNILHSLATVEPLVNEINQDIYSVPSDCEKTKISGLNFAVNGTKYESSISYTTWYIPVIADKKYRIIADNTAGSGSKTGRCSFSTQVPANNVNGTFILSLTAPASNISQFDYIPTENGYIACSIWHSDDSIVSFNCLGYGIIERITQLSKDTKKTEDIGLPQLYCGEKSLVSQSSGTVVKMSQKTSVPHDNVKVAIVCPDDIVIWFDWILTPYTQTITTSQYYGNGDKAICPTGNNLYTIYFAKGSKSGDTYTLSGQALSVSDVSYMLKEGEIKMSYDDCDVIVNNKGCETTARAIAYRDLPCFSHISDVHGDAIRYDNFMRISEYYGVDAAINTGDNVCVSFVDGMTFLNESIEKYPDVIQVACVGNHDNRGSNASNYQYFYKMFADAFEYELSSDKTYYYKDFASDNIRVISLNIYEERCVGYACRISKAQIDWLISTLQSTPQGYGVLIIAHSTEKWINEVTNKDNFYDYTTTRDWATQYANITGNPVSTIIDAFISKTSIDGSYSQTVYVEGSTEETTTEEVSYSADFTNLNTGVEFIAYINGHKHHDNIGYLENTTNIQLSLNICQGVASKYYDENDLPRGTGKGSVQDAVNLYYIDRANGTVRIVRIGSNMTYGLVERDKLVIPYRAS